MNAVKRHRPRTDVDVSGYFNHATREISREVYHDAAIFEAELENIFARTWILLGHESEIPAQGDYVVRNMANDSVLVCRDSKGEVHVSLNVCPHRGMRLCPVDAGNAPAFVCRYHGWTFRPDGRFVGAPCPEEHMHGDIYPKSQLGLTKARVHLYGGLIFACWSADGPSFDEYLGDFKFYADMLFSRTHRGMEVLGPPQRAILSANWKVLAEQFCVDGFHFLTAHRSLSETGLGAEALTGKDNRDNMPSLYTIQVSAEGHAARCRPRRKRGLDPIAELTDLPPPGITPEMITELAQRLSPQQLRLLATQPPTTGGLFPSCGFLFVHASNGLGDGGVNSMMHIKSFIPRGPDRVEFWNWFLAEKDAPEELKRAMREAALDASGVSGAAELDDAEVWTESTCTLSGVMGRRLTSKYQALLGEKKPEDWPGPGKVYDGFHKDDSQWNWWLQWEKLMTAGASHD